MGTLNFKLLAKMKSLSLKNDFHAVSIQIVVFQCKFYGTNQM